ncbi:MAG: hypothetical protein RLZZ618_1663 [Pseudomonadota bacterium]|jgi:putative colanic acid biosynthesis UDP-glucose lipid carrier transferase
MPLSSRLLDSSATELTAARPSHARQLPAERRSHRRFLAAPQSVPGFIAAVLEPFMSVGVLLGLHVLHDESLTPAPMALALLVLAVSFPGRNLFKASPWASAASICGAWFTLIFILLLCGYATRSLGHYRLDVILIWALVTPVLQWLAANAGRELIRWRAKRPQARRLAVIVGASDLGLRVDAALSGREDAQIRVAGFFDDRDDERVPVGSRDRLLGRLADVARFVDAEGVREVYITLPLGSQPRIVALLESLQGTTASLFFVPDIFGISIIQGRLEDVGGMPMVGICETPFTGINDVVKRASDIVMGGLILILISPLMAVLALGVKLSSPGPVIFRQRRNGLDGQEIMVYKFRSMRTQDNGSVVKQATKGDSRITPFGAFIRKTSLDELPQFINVLQGHMSIVGPRPHAVAHNEEYRQLIRAYMVRHKVRPGITGWAQVNGYRGETDTLDKMRSRVEYDLEYLRNWSLGLDLQIIARTLKLVVADRNAY